MDIHKDLQKYFSKELLEINKLLHEIERVKYEVEHGDSHFICDIHGICEVEKYDEEGSSDIGSCCFCGTELRRVDGEWYHYSAFDDNDLLIDKDYQTHGYNGFQHGEPTTEEERELESLKEKLNKYDFMKDKDFMLFGNPVKHSESPRIYQRLFKEKEVSATYGTKEVNTPLQIYNELKELDGANITYPFKDKVLNLVDYMDDYAENVGAINVIKRKGNKFIGYNTDGIALAKTIRETNQNILIIGAGATSKAVSLVLSDFEHNVTVVNRNSSPIKNKLREEYFNKFGIDFFIENKLPIQHFDIIINTTSAGLKDEEYPLSIDLLKKLISLSNRGIDVIYSKETPFMKLFKENNKEIENGKAMLVQQAIENMNIWYL